MYCELNFFILSYITLARCFCTETRSLLCYRNKLSSLRLDKNTFSPGEIIQVYFEASGNFDRSAWVGIVPSNVAHGSVAENDKYDLTYQFLEERTSGTLTFKAPQASGSYDLRMFDTDSNGREMASASFVVQSSTSGPITGESSDKHKP